MVTREQYKAAGGCHYCGNPNLRTKTRCERCTLAHNANSGKHRKKVIELGMCRVCLISPRVAPNTTCESCRTKQNEREKARNQMWRAACIKEYGGGCVCCGTTVSKYLQLDHVNNDGANHREQIGYRNMYCWAYTNKFPKGIFQLLCANCHQAKTIAGGCTPDDHYSSSSNSSSV